MILRIQKTFLQINFTEKTDFLQRNLRLKEDLNETSREFLNCETKA